MNLPDLNGRPLAWVAIVSLIGFLLYRRDRAEAPVWSLPLALALVAWFVGLIAWYLQHPAYRDHAEGTFPAIAWAFLHGAPLYHTVDAPERYTHIYGPYFYLAHALSLYLFGATVMASKLTGVIGGLGSVVALYLATWKISSARFAILACGYSVLMYLCFRHVSFWARPDSLLLLTVSSALAIGVLASPPWAAVGVGLLTGVALNLKLTGPLYIAPVWVLLAQRSSMSILAIAAPAFAFAVVAPFTSTERISASNFWFWFRESSENGLVIRSLRQNVEWTLFLWLPVLPIFSSPWWRTHRVFLIVLALGMIGVAIPAAKPGAGHYHLLPFAPLVGWIGAAALWRLRSTGVTAFRRWAVLARAILVVGLAIALTEQVGALQEMRKVDASAVTHEIQAFLNRHPSRHVAMGFAGKSMYLGAGPYSYYAPLVVFHTGRYPIDQAGVQEHQLAGIEIPSSTNELLRTCQYEYWLVPKGDEPFATLNMYPVTGHMRLFPLGFRKAFFESYQIVESLRFYDVWQCGKAKS